MCSLNPFFFRRASNSALKGQVDILNALVEEMKAAKEEMEGAKADVAKCRVCEAVKSRIYVWDLDYSVRESDLQKRFSKWSPKDITIHYDRHDRSSAAADIVFGNSLDAKEAFERNDDTLFFGTYIKIAHATALKEIEAAFEESSYSSDHEYESEAEEPDGWRIFVSNIKFGVISSKVEEFFSECGDVKSVLLHQDAKGRSLGRADVVFWARQDAEVALGYDGFNLFGRPLRIEKSNLRRNPKSH
jgi:RNA recognition motif-containing protein